MSSDFSVARILGLVGAILIAVGVAASIAASILGATFIWLFYVRDFRESFQPFMLESSYLLSQLNIIGWVLVIVSLYFSSKVYSEERIFRYAVYSVASIVGGIILAVFLAIMGAVLIIILIGIFFIIAAIVVVLASIVLMGYFMYKSLSLLAEKSGELLFRAAGITMFIAAVTMIILIGVLVELVGAIILAIAFYTLKPPINKSTLPKVQAQLKEDLAGHSEHLL